MKQHGFGEHLRRLRQQIGLTQQEVADELIKLAWSQHGTSVGADRQGVLCLTSAAWLMFTCSQDCTDGRQVVVARYDIEGSGISKTSDCSVVKISREEAVWLYHVAFHYQAAITTEVYEGLWGFDMSRTKGCRQANADPLDAYHGPRIRLASRLPYTAVGIGYALMLSAAALEGHAYPWVGLVLGGSTITALVVARQVMTQRESHKLAATDALTGLANRSRIYDVSTWRCRVGSARSR